MKPSDRTERRKTTLRKARQETTSKNRDRSTPRPPGVDLIMFDRPLSLVSLNVRGLRGDTPKPKEIKAWMASLSSPPPNTYTRVPLGQKRNSELREEDGILERNRVLERRDCNGSVAKN
jgi:hypothetical protein